MKEIDARGLPCPAPVLQARTAIEAEQLNAVRVVVNNCVKLAIRDSEVIPDLKELEDNGLQILVCGTCLTHFDLLENKQVGETTNMRDIVTAMQLADEVINI